MHWQWSHLFVARFVLGIGIGPKSSTVPVYAAECAPPAIRGGLVMMWQMWTAFGIMLGYVADLAFYKVPDTRHITGLNWRLMLASASVTICITLYAPFTHQNNKGWYARTLLNGTSLFLPRITALAHVKGSILGYFRNFESLKRLRRHPVQAARDLYCQSLFPFIIVQSLTRHQTFTSPHVTVFAYDWVCIVSAGIVYLPRRLLMTAR